LGSDPEEMGFGLNLGYGGFTLGGAWYNGEDVGVFGPSLPIPTLFGIEQEDWTAGLSYTTGPWTVGVAYLEDEIDIGIAGFSVDMNTWQVGGGYNLGSGVDVGLDVQMSEVDLPIFGGITYDSTSAGLVLSVAF